MHSYLSPNKALLALFAISLVGCPDPNPSPSVAPEAGAEQGGVSVMTGGVEGGDEPTCMPNIVEDGVDGESCDGLDNDCDGQVDEGFSVGERCERRLNECSAEGVFECDEAGARRCNAPELVEREETCDELDNDCDGSIDEGFNTEIDLNNCGSCGLRCEWDHASGVCEAGRCQLVACDMGWTNDNGDNDDGCECETGASERCDGVDNDCDGRVDEDFSVGALCTAGVGSCLAMGALACASEDMATCDARPGSPEEEVCDGLDNDCDGLADEDYDEDADGAPSCEQCLMCGGECAEMCRNNDCLDSDPSVFPTAYDRCEDSIDQNCDGVDAPCTESFARAVALSLVPSSDALGTCPDLNGDELGDNAFGSISGIANVSIANYIETHEMNIILSAQGYELSNANVRFNLSVLLGRWIRGTNDYTSLANNYNEAGDPVMRFPFSRLDGARQDGGFLEGGPGQFIFTAGAGDQLLEIPIEDAYIKGQFTVDAEDPSKFSLTQGLVSGRIDKVALNESLVLIDPPIAAVIERQLVADIDLNGDGITDNYSVCLLVTLEGVGVEREVLPSP